MGRLDDLVKLISEDSRDKSLSDLFLDEIVEASELYQKNISKDDKPSKRVFKPSSMHRDYRYIYLKASGKIEDSSTMDLRSMLNIEFGNAGHELVQSKILPFMRSLVLSDGTDGLIPDSTTIRKIPDKYMTPGKEKEVLFYNSEWNISGMLDFLGRFDNLNVLGEIKTENYDKWKIRYDIDDRHKVQASCYSLCFNTNDILFPYVGVGVPYKIKVPIKVIHYVVQEEDKDYIKDKITKLNDLIDKEKVPPRCKKCLPWCGYKDLCKNI